MHTVTRRLAFTLVLALAAHVPWTSAQDDDEQSAESANQSEYAYHRRYVVEGDQFQVRLNLESILNARGLAFEVTTIDVPGLTDVDPAYISGEYVAFCGPPFTGTWIPQQPHSLVICPITIAVYTVPADDDGLVHVSYQPLHFVGAPMQVQYPAQAMNEALEEMMLELLDL